MKIITDIAQLKLHNSIITLGKFDGFHIGHQLLINTAISRKQRGMNTVVFTFDVNPLSLYRDGSRQMSGTEVKEPAFQTIQDREERIHSLQPSDIDYLILFPFNKQTMSMKPEQFVKEILVEKLDVKIIVAGYDFRFGKDRTGDVNTLQRLGEEYGFSVQILDKVKVRLEHYDEPMEVSSTLIKQEISLGHMENVHRMLGRPFCVTGTVEHGKHLGSTLGFPTINFRISPDKVMPPNGVYATITLVPDNGSQDSGSEERTTEYHSITNVGYRPTFDDGKHRNVETNIFDFSKDIYGYTVTIAFCHFIRPERKFDSVEQLVQTIEENKKTVREWFSV